MDPTQRRAWHDATIVDARCLEAAAADAQADAGEHLYAFLAHEPLLTAVLKRDLLQICGKLALAGASPSVTRGVAGDVHTLVGFAIRAVQLGYRGLLNDLMPPEAADAPAGSLPDEPPAAPDQRAEDEWAF